MNTVLQSCGDEDVQRSADETGKSFHWSWRSSTIQATAQVHPNLSIFVSLLIISAVWGQHSQLRREDAELTTKAPFIATQLNSTQLNCQLSIRRRHVGGSERRDPVEVVSGSW